jgi:hypothetical protein
MERADPLLPRAGRQPSVSTESGDRRDTSSE